MQTLTVIDPIFPLCLNILIAREGLSRKNRVSQVTRMRKRHRFNTRMTRIILLISFLFFFGRFVYSSIGAWYHHQDKTQSQQSSLTVDTADR